MKSNSGTKQCSERTIQEICEIQAQVHDLAMSRAPHAASDSVAHMVQKIAERLLAAAHKVIDLGRDLNGITDCMVDVADNDEADDRDLDHARQILAWAGWTGDLTTDALAIAGEIICAIHDLIGSNCSKQKKGRA